MTDDMLTADRPLTSVDYANANRFLTLLRAYRNVFPRQQLSTLRGQALSGDIDGAMRGLQRLIDHRREAAS